MHIKTLGGCLLFAWFCVVMTTVSTAEEPLLADTGSMTVKLHGRSDVTHDTFRGGIGSTQAS